MPSFTEKIALRLMNLGEMARYGKKLSHADLGEDILLACVLKPWENKNGFYVDVGAHHPSKLSNTKALYDMGWSGINIEANPAALPVFEKERPRDINLSCAVTEADGDTAALIHVANQDFGSFAGCNYIEGAPEYPPKEVRRSQVSTRRLDSIFREHLKGRDIDVLTMDIEGGELAALQSNDWMAYRPRIVAVEVHPFGKAPIDMLESDPVLQFLRGKGYVFFSLTLYTWFFRDGEMPWEY